MHYKRKKEIVDAEKYQPGMEDGFAAVIKDPSSGQLVVLINSVGTKADPEPEITTERYSKTKIRSLIRGDEDASIMPFIQLDAGLKVLLNEGDWIVRHFQTSGDVVKMSTEEFAAHFEPMPGSPPIE